jgi:ribosomal protein S18 acetylase RimI-like enzyme
MCLHPDFQSKGHGKLFLARILNRLRLQHYPAVGLAVTRNNISALKLYTSFGFKTVDKFSEFIQLNNL